MAGLDLSAIAAGTGEFVANGLSGMIIGAYPR